MSQANLNFGYFFGASIDFNFDYAEFVLGSCDYFLSSNYKFLSFL